MLSRIHSLPHQTRYFLAIGLLILSGIFIFFAWQKTTSSQLASLSETPSETDTTIADDTVPSDTGALSDNTAMALSPLGGVGESVKGAVSFFSKNIRYSDEEQSSLWKDAVGTKDKVVAFLRHFGHFIVKKAGEAVQYGFEKFQRQVIP